MPSWRPLAGTAWLGEAGGMTPDRMTYPDWWLRTREETKAYNETMRRRASAYALYVMAKGGQSRKKLDAVVDAAMAVWPATKPKTRRQNPDHAR